MSKIKNGGLDQYGAEPCEQQQFGTAGVKGVNSTSLKFRNPVFFGWANVLLPSDKIHTFYYLIGLIFDCTFTGKHWLLLPDAKKPAQVIIGEARV